MKIQSTQDFCADKLKLLIYGESGTGKTTLAGTIDAKVLIVSAESGLLSLSGKQLDVVDITTDDNGELLPEEKTIQRLGEVDNIGDLVKYGYGFFNVKADF